MDMLVLILLALFLIIIALMVIIYVIVRRNHVDKKFDKTMESEMFDDYDDDEDDFEISNLNIVMPISFKNNDSDNKAEENNEVTVIEPVVIEKNQDEKIEEVINVLINKRNYIFLANNNVVSRNDYIKLILDGKVYFGVVTKANYKRDISLLKVKPRKLNIIKSILKSDNKEEVSVNQPTDVEYVPVKKDRI